MHIHDELPILFLHKYRPSETLSFHHKSFDFIYVLSGETHIHTDYACNAYPSGAVCLINPGYPYTLSSEHDNVVLHMGVSPDFFYRHLSKDPFLTCDSASEPGNDYTRIRNLLASIAAKYAENPSKNALNIKGLLLLLLDELEDHSQSLLTKEQLARIPEKYHARVIQMMEYIHLHYQEPLSLPCFAEALFLSPQYVSAFLKKYMGTSFKKLLNKKRLFHAERMLRFTDLPVTEIAVQNGFSGENTFYKNFCASYGMSPQEYRIHASSYQIPDGKADFFADSETIAMTAALSQPQSVTVNMLHPGHLRKNICTMINIGNANHLLSLKYQQALLDSCQRLGFRYIRMQELVSSAFIPRTLPDYAYRFQNVSTVLSFLYQNRLIPFVELSQRCQESRSMLSAPASVLKNRRFFQLFESFLSYCASHWPASWLAEWKFEVWMPTNDTLESYAKNMLQIKALLQQYFKGAGFGGPGFDPCFSSYTLEQCLTVLSKENVQPDFISVHLNYFIRDDKLLQISTDKDLLQKRCGQYSRAIQKHFPGLPFYVTEWTSAYISDLPLSRSRYQAVFICKSILDLQDSCSLLGYQLFMEDTSIRTSDTTKFDYWEQGLVNTDFIRSPAFYAFGMMRERGNRIISCGPDYLVTQKSPGHYYAAAFHYAHFNAAHTGITGEKYHFENIYDIFEAPADKNIRLELYGLSSGFYRVTRRFLDKFHGSYLDILIGEYTHSNISRDEFLQYAREPFDIQNSYCLKACIPEERTIYISVKDILSLSSVIPVHCICTWEIQKLSSPL